MWPLALVASMLFITQKSPCLQAHTQTIQLFPTNILFAILLTQFKSILKKYKSYVRTQVGVQIYIRSTTEGILSQLTTL